MVLEKASRKFKLTHYRPSSPIVRGKRKKPAAPFELMGVEHEPGKAAFALLTEPGTGKYVGSAFITLGREMKERLWKRVQEHAGPPPEAMKKRPATQWVKPGVRHDPRRLRYHAPERP
ncbi:hypothetical protein [Mesorhizobium sp.]|uniref:hypothetical protein n=1 Tax=Mesorhizobium sp. TaxID=1871066 RepID=UPI0012128CD8|nr:hypothetical protein [Mesorhizobium sp.]TJW44279.1 MAG: hypothetical protein E5X59_20830 [Mesorhizobium sp.]